MIDPAVALAGLIVGFAVGLTGMGGGALMTPILVLVFGIAPLAAVSSDLVASLIMKPVGAAVHAGRGTVRVPAVAALLVKMYLDHRNGTSAGVDERLRIKKAPTLAIGASIGFIVGITSVGSGTLVIILLLFLYPRLRGSQMVGTDLAQAIPMVGSAALAHIVFGDFKLGLTLSILIGSIPGVLIGASVSSYAPTAFLRGALAAVLLVSGLKLVNVPTLVIGIVLLASLLVLAAPWLWIRASGRTLREVSG